VIGKTSSGNLLIYSLFDNIADDITVDALATLKNTELKAIIGNSASGNLLTYSLVSSPSFSPEFFKIEQGTVKSAYKEPAFKELLVIRN